MGRLVLNLLVVVSLLWVTALASGPAHALAGNCMTPAGNSHPHAAAGRHQHRPDVPDKGPVPVMACCLAAALGLPSGLPFLVARARRDTIVLAFVDAAAKGRVVEPAERPPRIPFLLTA